MSRRRIIQRTPDFGLKIRMQRAGGGNCCIPEIGAAHWYNPATGAYDLDLVVVALEGGRLMSRGLYVAQVAGRLCDATVTWNTVWVLTNGYGAPPTGTPGRGLAVGITPPIGHNGIPYIGVLTATATVTQAAQQTILAPITLIIVSTEINC